MTANPVSTSRRSGEKPAGAACDTAPEPSAPDQPATEVELKLHGAASDLAAAIAPPALRQFRPGRSRRKKLIAAYYDTADGALRRGGLALRVRQESAAGGDDAFVMTLKAPAPDSGGIGRAEWSQPVNGPELDHSALAHWFAATGASDLPKPQTLEPVFRTEVRRQLAQLTTSAGVVELACDTGHIVAGDRREEIAELELELISGSPAAIYEIATFLTGKWPLRVAVLSKAERGYALACGRTPAPVRYRDVQFPADVTFGAALRLALQAAYGHALANLAPASLPDCPDGVHQVRVALRRLRSLLELVRQVAPSAECERLRAGARDLMSALGGARNLDVFATGVLREAAAAFDGRIDLSAMETHVTAMREQERRRAHAALQAPECSQLLAALGGWIARSGWREDASAGALSLFDAPARPVARQAIARRRKKVLKKGRRFNRLNAPQLHEVRLALKKLRYTAEALGPVSAGPVSAQEPERETRRLARLQDVFGRYNDLHGARDILAALRNGEAGDADADACHAIGAMQAWLIMEERQAHNRLCRRWKQFRKLYRR